MPVFDYVDLARPDILEIAMEIERLASFLVGTFIGTAIAHFLIWPPLRRWLDKHWG